MARQRRNAGGAAVNAGSEYQHRIGAFVSALMIVGADLSHLVGSDHTLGIPSKFSYETLNFIDDINVTTDINTKLYIQAKRSLTKPVLQDVFDQFAQQHFSNTSKEKSIYSLITSSRSSSTVSRHSKTVLDAIRAAPSEDFSPIHNEILQETYRILVAFATSSLKKCGLSYEDESVRDFLLLTHIDICDLEAGEAMEKAALLLLFKYASNDSKFLWEKLLRDNSWAASNRMTFEAGTFAVKYEQLLRRDEVAQQWFYEAELDTKDIPNGIEYLLISVSNNHAPNELFGIDNLSFGDLILIGTPRFGKDCHKVFRFDDGKCIQPNDVACTVLARAASAKALNRVIESRKLFDTEMLKSAGNKIIFAGDKINSGVLNGSSCSRKYRPSLSTAFHNNLNPSRCLICNQTAVEKGAFTVEIDESERPIEFGIVHPECWKPTHRVVGTISGNFVDYFPLLRRFDADAYLLSIRSGQGSIKSLPAKSNKFTPVFLWTGEEYNSNGSFCLQITLNNGGHQLAIHRGRVERLDKPVAERKAKLMNDVICQQLGHDDPMCLARTEDGYSYGPKSTIEENGSANADLIPAANVTLVRYEEKFAAANDEYKNWYAPLCYFLDAENQKYLRIDGSILLLTDPFSVASVAQGLEPLGIDLQNFETRVLTTDAEFDRLARTAFSEGADFVIDPSWDEDGRMEPRAKIKDVKKVSEQWRNEE